MIISIDTCRGGKPMHHVCHVLDTWILIWYLSWEPFDVS